MSCSDGCTAGCACVCCEGTEALTPETIWNRPGLDALAYRAGTHASFLETMEARLSSADLPALAELRTRSADDPALALLDGWATVADVLTFYQERLANEGYLRTATERRSVQELARLIGYEPRPGVAASAYLAFELEAGSAVEIPAGCRAQSTPGPGELPQTFETAEPLAARAAWNDLKARQTRPQALTPKKLLTGGAVWCKGISTNLRANDPLLIDFGAARGLYRVLAVTSDPLHDRTRVDVEPWNPPPAADQAAHVQAAAVLAVLHHFRHSENVVSPASQTTKRVLVLLDSLESKLKADESAGLTALHKDILPKLAAEQEGAQEAGFKKIAPWIQEVRTRLISAAAAQPGGSPNAGPVADLSGVLASLGKPPSIPPRSRQQLALAADQVFGPASDLFPRLVAASRPALQKNLYRAWGNVPVTPATAVRVYALRMRAAVFGHNAPLEPVRNADEVVTGAEEWDLVPVEGESLEEKNIVHLDTTYPQILPGSWIVLDRPNALGSIPDLILTRAQEVRDISRAAYGLAGKETRVRLDRSWLVLEGQTKDTFAVIRGTSVYTQSELLELADEPLDPVQEAVCGDEIELQSLYDGLAAGRWVLVSGERTDLVATAPVSEEPDPLGLHGTDPVPVPGVPACELAMLAGVEQIVDPTLPGDRVHTRLLLANPLAYCYKRDTVVIYGNVVRATHGETRVEVLGAGDAAQPLQRFTLRQSPLTYVSAATPSGIASTLEVRVNEVRWHAAPSPALLGPDDRSYTTRTEGDGRVSVVFGDGRRGARLPTGPDNVQARYRIGIGKGGNVPAEKINILASRPLGVKNVINPLPATGGADPESRDQARRRAPLAVLALDRLVSVTDYADFARTFAGIGKAAAARLSDGRREILHLTIAGEDDIPIDPTSDLYQNLADALYRFGDPRLPVQIALRDLSFLVVIGGVRVLPDYLWDNVEPKIRQALGNAFAFDRRCLGQDVALSEVIAAIQRVPGVDFVDVDLLGALPGSTDLRDFPALLKTLESDQPRERMIAELARRDPASGEILPAQLLVLRPDLPETLLLKEIVP
jgi:predicted phage baseplate assembly protein